MDWWHVVCMWGEPCSVFSLIVLIFYACACVRARSATNNRRRPLRQGHQTVLVRNYPSVYIVMGILSAHSILTSRHRSFQYFTWQWQCRECTNNIRVYLYKVLCIVILMAACFMEMISESSYIFNSCYSK